MGGGAYTASRRAVRHVGSRKSRPGGKPTVDSGPRQRSYGVGLKLGETLMSWNVQAAVHYLDWHAAGHSLGYCAQYTREAIEHGGVYLERHGSAKDYGRSLLFAGFTEVH